MFPLHKQTHSLSHTYDDYKRNFVNVDMIVASVRYGNVEKREMKFCVHCLMRNARWMQKRTLMLIHNDFER
jgi:hypothetical protein